MDGVHHPLRGCHWMGSAILVSSAGSSAQRASQGSTWSHLTGYNDLCVWTALMCTRLSAHSEMELGVLWIAFQTPLGHETLPGQGYLLSGPCLHPRPCSHRIGEVGPFPIRYRAKAADPNDGSQGLSPTERGAPWPSCASPTPLRPGPAMQS